MQAVHCHRQSSQSTAPEEKNSISRLTVGQKNIKSMLGITLEDLEKKNHIYYVKLYDNEC